MLKEKLRKHKIILASGSPRRQQFFRELGLDFEVRVKDLDESFPEELKGSEITNFLAELKANAFDKELTDNEIVITSDTIVWHKNNALGKPINEEDAFRILKSLSNDTHEVITSVCFKTSKGLETFSETTKVTFDKLSDESIHHYIKHYKPLDKAGAYGIQEWIGLIGISKIEGSYSNVVGLPTHIVFDYFNRL